MRRPSNRNFRLAGFGTTAFLWHLPAYVRNRSLSAGDRFPPLLVAIHLSEKRHFVSISRLPLGTKGILGPDMDLFLCSQLPLLPGVTRNQRAWQDKLRFSLNYGISVACNFSECRRV